MSRILQIAAILLLAGAGASAASGCSHETTEAAEDVGEEALTDGTELPTLGARIDRIGRPEVTNFLVRLPAIKEVYNTHDSFDVPVEQKAQYVGLFKTSLAMYDNYDGVVDMDESTVARLASIMVDDTLRIDLNKPCSGVNSTGYFDLERAELLGAPAASCGGRSPNEDAFDTLATIYTNGPSKLEPRVTDLVDSSTGVAGAEFPYLVKAHLLRTPPVQ